MPPLYYFRPVFTLLRFQTHNKAWAAFEKLEAAIKEGAPFRQAWTKTNWYKTVRAKAKELNAINHMLMEDIADEPLNGYGEYDTEEYMPMTMETSDYESQSTSISSSSLLSSSSSSSSSSSFKSNAIVHDDEFGTLISTHEVTAEPFVNEVNADQVIKSRRSAAEIEAQRAKRNSMRELKRISDSNLSTIQRSDRSNVFPFTSTAAATRSPDQFYHSDDEMLSVSADKLRG